METMVAFTIGFAIGFLVTKISDFIKFYHGTMILTPNLKRGVYEISYDPCNPEDIPKKRFALFSVEVREKKLDGSQK